MKKFTDYKEYDKKENLKIGSKVVHGAVGHDHLQVQLVFQYSKQRHSVLEDYKTLLAMTTLDFKTQLLRN